MAENLSVLSDALSLPTADFLHKLRSDDTVRSGLDAFYCLLRRGLESSGDQTLHLQSWTDSQIHAISSFANSIASSSRSLSGTHFLSSLLSSSSEINFVFVAFSCYCVI
jgi:hypothetical protein